MGESPGSAVRVEAVSTDTVLGLFTRTGAVMASIVAVAFVGLFYRWFVTQGMWSWNRIEDWGHAFAIPAISGYLVWIRREEIAKLDARVFWPGLAPMLLGIATYFAGIVTIRNHMVQGFAMILTLFGVVLLLTGPSVMRRVFLPIAFLGFGVTLAEKIMLAITFKLKLIASQGSWILLSVTGPIFGYHVDLSGNTLLIQPNQGAEIPLNVADACSGMRMVVAFYALAGAVVLFSAKTWWQRIAIMLIAGPVAVAMNVFRVAVLGWLSLIDPNLASGDAHMIIGTLLLIPSLLLFMGLVWVLNRLERDPGGASA